MTEESQRNKALLKRVSITQTISIQLTRLKVCTHSNKGIRSHKCRLCKDSAKMQADATRSLVYQTGEKPFLCTLCNYKCSRSQGLNNRIMTHTGEKHYNCAFCTKAFKTKEQNSRHEKTCKLNPRRSDPRWVELQKSFKCQVCHFSAAVKSQLKNHVMTHTGEKPIPCTLCNRKFRSETNLRKHIFTHTGEKPYNCQYCTKEFARGEDLKKHEKVCKLNPKQGDAKWVEEQKKFKCPFCTYRTITKRSLEDHLRSHTGEKPYNCPFCLYKCSTNSYIHRHLRQKHALESRYKCPECDFTTLLTSKLLNHVKQFHLKL